MKTFFRYIFLFLLFTNCKTSSNEKPKLIVGIVIDQMRYDYLIKYKSRFGEDGFNKLLNKGFSFENCYLNHTPTHTAVGHASIYTGTTPNYHGIMGNNWYDKVSKKSIYCVEDKSYKTIGSKSKTGKKSPFRLVTNTITDQLHLSQNMNGKVISISLKDRAAILPGGHSANAAYWFDGADYGKWITSSYYMTDLPKWVKNFNTSNTVEKLSNSNWKTFYNINTYQGVDNSPYEVAFKGEKKPTFPHKLKELKSSNNNFDLLKNTPFGNDLTTLFAIDAIENEALGKTEYTDFLCLSYSATDGVGHQFGIESVELEDTYIRMDLEIAKILNYLDENIGKNNYLLFLTSDHGAANNSAYLKNNKIPAHYSNHKKIIKDVKNLSVKIFKNENLIEHIQNNNIYLNQKEIKEADLDEEFVINKLCSEILKLDNIYKVYTKQDLVKNYYTDRISKNIQNGYNQKKSGDIIFLEIPSTISKQYQKGGTTHGTPYNYDTHIPLLFYGKNIKNGNSSIYHPVIDIAPTIADLLKIEQPNGSIGNVMQELY